MTERSPIKSEQTVDVRTAARWLLILAFAAFVIVLVAYARGGEHNRGDEVGAMAMNIVEPC